MNEIVPQYPWNEGDHLYASALNAAIANGPYLNNSGVANVLDFKADPTGVRDSTTAFQNALATGQNVYAPTGTYIIRGQLTLGSQALRGDGPNTVLLVDGGFDPTVTTGVIVTSAAALWPIISDLTIQFVQPLDLATTAVSASPVGDDEIAVASAAGLVVGMSVVNRTHPASLPSPVYFSQNIAAAITAIVGNTLTLNAAVRNPGVSVGDTLQFASQRSMFKTLAAGGTTTPGGPAIQYPWAIYAGQYIDIRDVLIQWAWNGIYIRGSSFEVKRANVFAYNIGVDIDQCYNFPSIDGFTFYTWGEPVTGGPRDALTNVFYDSYTIAANLGELDGGAIDNFQSWTGIVNLTSAWSFGAFTNLMLDGDHSCLNISSTNNGGFAQFSNFYSTKGTLTLRYPVWINAAAGFRTTFTNFFMTSSLVPDQPGILAENGATTISGGYIWNGQQHQGVMIEVDGGVLALNDVQLDASSGRTDTYINMAGTASLQMSDCTFPTAPATGGVGLNSGPNNSVTLDNIFWNGWPATTSGYKYNNANSFISPVDFSSMQAGSLSFTQLSSTHHYNTAYGVNALAQLTDAAINTTGLGSHAGFSSQGSNNTFVGATAGYNATSGTQNTCVGSTTGYSLTTGSNNTLLGSAVGGNLTTGSGNIFILTGASSIGYGATTSNTFLLGENITALMRATGINTSTPAFFLDWLPAMPSYASDAAAASGGVGVGQIYRNGSAIMVRVS